MNFATYIKDLGRGAENPGDLSEQDAHDLFGAMLDGGVPDLELGAILIALRVKSESLPELLGFYSALSERLFRLRAPAGKAKPIIFPSYNGARHQPNLLPLLALLLQRFGVPVLIHGPLTGNGRIATAYILRELGVMPCASLAQAQEALDKGAIAFVPTAVLAPGLTDLLSLRARLGVRSSAHSIAKLIDPFESETLRIVSVSHPPYLDMMREFLLATNAHALLLRSTEGEPFANPKRRPKIEYFKDASAQVLFEAEAGPVKSIPTLPAAIDAPTTAAWIKGALSGQAPVPLPIVNQLACCLYASGYTTDMNQAKAIVAVETGSLAAA
ncbi:MAG: DNA-binding protein YbiB [Betaproteobacteria bacterium]|jgi:anthranilate phosphoribosyltransferase|nr:DNA-binding protein YbiB [Betaproteobacteria bacterium]